MGVQDRFRPGGQRSSRAVLLLPGVKGHPSCTCASPAPTWRRGSLVVSNHLLQSVCQHRHCVLLLTLMPACTRGICTGSVSHSVTIAPMWGGQDGRKGLGPGVKGHPSSVSPTERCDSLVVSNDTVHLLQSVCQRGCHVLLIPLTQTLRAGVVNRSILPQFLPCTCFPLLTWNEMKSLAPI